MIATNASYAEIARTRGHKARGEVTIVRNAPSTAWASLPLQVREGALEQIQLAYLGTIVTSPRALCPRVRAISA